MLLRPSHRFLCSKGNKSITKWDVQVREHVIRHFALLFSFKTDEVFILPVHYLCKTPPGLVVVLFCCCCAISLTSSGLHKLIYMPLIMQAEVKL